MARAVSHRPLSVPKVARSALAALAICLVLLGIAHGVRMQINFLQSAWPVLSLWPDASAQARRHLGPDLYDMLLAADAALPRRAAVLLVTPGTDPRHAEYFVFHRALYHLAPRLVWWVNPAPSDGTWEARWWRQASLTPAALRAIASDRNLQYILFYRTAVPPGLGTPVELTPIAQLISLTTQRVDATREVAAQTNGPVSVIGLVAGLVVILALGGLLIWIASRLGYAPGRIESVALAWPLGAGATSLAMLWLNALGLPLSTQIPAITVLAAAGVCIVGVLTWRARANDTTGPAVRACNHGSSASVESGSGAAARGARAKITGIAPGVCLLALIVVEVACVAILAVGRPLVYWDSWVNWAMKARIIALDGHISAGMFADSSRVVTQLDYPLLVPLAEVWTFFWAGTLDDRLAGIQAVLFFASLLGIGFAVLRRLGLSRVWALAVAAGLGSTTYIVGVATLVFADIPLAVYATIAGTYTVIWLETRSRGALLIAALAAGFMPWTKREGILLLLALCVALLLVGRARRGVWLTLGPLALAAVLLSGPWWAFVARQGIRNVAFSPMTLATLRANISRLPVIARLELTRLADPGWSYLWAVLVLALSGLPSGRPGRRAGDLLLATALVYLALGSCVYVFSDFVPYQQHVVASIDRMVSHVALLPVLWIVSRSRVENSVTEAAPNDAPYS